jgi:hypothetical protein
MIDHRAILTVGGALGAFLMADYSVSKHVSPWSLAHILLSSTARQLWHEVAQSIEFLKERTEARFDSMEKRFGTTEGLTETMEKGFDALDRHARPWLVWPCAQGFDRQLAQGFDRQLGLLDQGFDRQLELMDARFGAMAKQFNTLEKRFDKRFDTLDEHACP